MSMSLSQLFEIHQSNISSGSKNEESRPDQGASAATDNKPSTNSKNQSRPKKSQKRKRSSAATVSTGDNNVVDGKEPTTEGKRIKTEQSSDIEYEKDNESVMEISENNELDEQSEDDGHNNKRSRFYENYAESAKVLYNYQRDDSRNQSYSEALQVVHSALFPMKSKVANERRLVGDNSDDKQDNNYPSRSLSGRYQPRKRRVALGRKDTSYRLETQEEVVDRVGRMEGYDERDGLRERWKRRNVNFQTEEDIGNAFLLRAQRNIGEKLRIEEKERRAKERMAKKQLKKEEKKKELEKIKELESSDLLEEDDEIKEQNQLLAHLSQHDTSLNEAGEDAIHPTSGQASNPTSEISNYWKRGYVTPRTSSEAHKFNLSVEKMVQSESNRTFDELFVKSSEDNENIQAEIKISYSAFMSQTAGQRHIPRLFFEPNKFMISNNKRTFRPGFRSCHIHQFTNMAARALCGGNTNDLKDSSALEDKYLQLLCLRYDDSMLKRESDATICSSFRKNGYLMELVEDQGKNMLLFLQNTWRDPTEVATKLGISNCFQESPLRGNLLHCIKNNFQAERLRVKKSHKIRSVNWDHENSNDDIESDHEDLKEDVEDVEIVADEELIPEGTTKGVVVDAMTLESSLTIDKKGFITPSKNTRDAFISPNTLYSHIEGTSPPVPYHPLDTCAVIFGPVDRYSKFYHTGAKMDSSIYKLMLSTLMKRIGRARALKTEFMSQKTQEQILNLIEEYANINENKFYLRYTCSIQDPLDSDIPLVELYRGVTGYCSYMANGYLEMHHTNTFPNGIEKESPHHKLDESKQNVEVNFIAEKIWEFCRPKIRQNSLLRFPKLRITYGIALICRSLNPSAAEILSRPIGGEIKCTPMDLFKETLEDMESKNFIASNRNRNSEGNSMLAAELEFIFHDAAEFFQDAVELDPTNVEYQLWHIGCLASCLLISSGNSISNSVHVYPSQMKGTFLNNETVAHEVRPCMKKYREVRIELSIAIRALLTLTKYQDSSKAHFAVFSLLEWGQVIGLLVGSQINEFSNAITTCHAFHFRSWAYQEPFTFLKEYKGMQDMIDDKSQRAQILENNPGNISNWRKFILALGPISVTKADGWWGEGRLWWRDSLLHIHSPNARERVLCESSILALKNILKQLRGVVTTAMTTSQCSSMTDENKSKNEDDNEYPWLPTLENDAVQDNDNFEVSKELRDICYREKLPKTKKNVSGDKYERSLDSPTSLSDQHDDSFLPTLTSISHEILAYKIFISCHLFGVDDPSVQEYIYYNLYYNCVFHTDSKTINENSDEYRVLVWLSSMGINIEDSINAVNDSIESRNMV